jgi:hypothetical protein
MRVRKRNFWWYNDVDDKYGWAYVFGLVVMIVSVFWFLWPAHARDVDGRYANSPLKPWFDGLKSKKGSCCSDADGYAVSDPDWESASGHYRVRIEDQWWVVPDDAVITEPNRAGRTMVWPNITRGIDQKITKMDIRCFMPGSMT